MAKLGAVGLSDAERLLPQRTIKTGTASYLGMLPVAANVLWL